MLKALSSLSVKTRSSQIVKYNMKRTTSQLELRQQLTKDVWRQIIKLDNLEQFEESYALTQEWREWLLDPQINNNF